MSTARIEPVQVVLAGAGAFGRSLLARSAALPWLRFVAVVDPSPAATASVASLVGPDVPVLTSLSQVDVQADVLVEATGDVVSAAEHALGALERHWHLVLVTKELDVVVGPEIAARFAARGLICTPVDGDQPSLLIQLVQWARELGLQVHCAGKASEYDFVLDESDTLHWRDQSVEGLSLRHAMNERATQPAAQRLAGRHAMLAALGLPRRTVADLCEMGVAANALGLLPDQAALHAPLAHPTELADLFQHREHGGLLSATNRIDVFNAYRRVDEMSFAGGVFVTVSTDDTATWSMLAEKGHVVAANGRAALIANPRHLLGVEAPRNILMASRGGWAMNPLTPHPHVSLVAIAAKDLSAGFSVAITDPHHHAADALHGELRPTAEAGGLCPYYLCMGRRLRHAVGAGQVLRDEDFDEPPPGVVEALRTAQLARFAL